MSDLGLAAKVAAVTEKDDGGDDSDYIVRPLDAEGVLYRGPDLAAAIEAADLSPTGAYIDHVGENDSPGDPLGLGLTKAERAAVLAFAEVFARPCTTNGRRVSPEARKVLDRTLSEVASEETGLPPLLLQETIARVGATFGRES